MQPTDSPIMERFYDSVYLDDEKVDSDDKKYLDEKYNEVSLILIEMSSAKEPLELCEEADINDLIDVLTDLSIISSKLFLKYINILKSWDEKWNLLHISGFKTTLDLDDYGEPDCKLLKNYLTYCDIDLDKIDVSFEALLEKHFSSNQMLHSYFFPEVLQILIQGGLKLPTDAIEKYIKCISGAALNALTRVCKIRPCPKQHTTILNIGFGDYKCFKILFDNCLPCASSKGLWYMTKYGSNDIFHKALDLLLKGADPLEQFDGSNAFENLLANNESDAFLKRLVSNAIIIQSYFRGWLARKRYAWNPHTS